MQSPGFLSRPGPEGRLSRDKWRAPNEMQCANCASCHVRRSRDGGWECTQCGTSVDNPEDDDGAPAQQTAMAFDHRYANGWRNRWNCGTLLYYNMGGSDARAQGPCLDVPRHILVGEDAPWGLQSPGFHGNNSPQSGFHGNNSPQCSARLSGLPPSAQAVSSRVSRDGTVNAGYHKAAGQPSSAPGGGFPEPRTLSSS